MTVLAPVATSDGYQVPESHCNGDFAIRAYVGRGRTDGRTDGLGRRDGGTEGRREARRRGGAEGNEQQCWYTRTGSPKQHIKF